jgi:hypothetical protein
MASLYGTASNLQMALMDPPNVAGWPAYYQTPEFYRLWLNTITLPVRWAFTDSLVNGIRAGGVTSKADSTALARQVSDPGNPQVLVREFSTLLFAFDLTAYQEEFLVRDVLIPGLPDYEWTGYWNDYAADPNSSQKREAVATRINALLKFMMRMAEFELT